MLITVFFYSLQDDEPECIWLEHDQLSIYVSILATWNMAWLSLMKLQATLTYLVSDILRFSCLVAADFIYLTADILHSVLAKTQSRLRLTVRYRVNACDREEKYEILKEEYSNRVLICVLRIRHV